MDPPRLSVVIPTLGRPETLARALQRLAAQDAPADWFEVIVVSDAADPDPPATEAAAGTPPFRLRVLTAATAGASAGRNAGWKVAEASLVLFLGDDVLAAPALVSEHLASHRERHDEKIGVLGRVRWAPELQATPFMRWLDNGIQFDYGSIKGTEAGWGRFYTVNVSVKRVMLERVGGFDESFPFLYEDLDLAYRMSGEGFRVLYNPAALGDHLHPTTLEGWRNRIALVAAAERRFVRKHPEVQPYFHELFKRAAEAPPARGRAARLTGVVPKWVPWLGDRVWASADMVYRQALAPNFLAAWQAAGDLSSTDGAPPLHRGEAT